MSVLTPQDINKATTICTKRLMAELAFIKKFPIPGLSFGPNQSNILEWYFVMDGVKGTIIENGKYLGKIVFPPDYPSNPPAICLITNNGLFIPNTAICLSITNYHRDTWNPSWKSYQIVGSLQSLTVEAIDGTFTTVGSTRIDKNKIAEFAEKSISSVAKWKLNNPDIIFS